MERTTLLDRARAGNEAAFEELVGRHRRELHVHCYRMLGSVADADDLLQETLAAAWRGLPTFAGQASVRTWLYRIATNRCLNAIRDGRRRPRPEPVPPFVAPEPTARDAVTWLQPYPDRWLDELPDPGPGPDTRWDRREAVTLAFVTALQRLSPRQAAALVLCDVLGFPLAEAAAAVEASPTVVKGLLQRARAALATMPGPVPPDAHGLPGERGPDKREQAVAARFADALVRGDVDALVALLVADAWLVMPPAPHRYHGRDAIAAFFTAGLSWSRDLPHVLLPVGANGQPALARYVGRPGSSSAGAAGVLVLTVIGEDITSIHHGLGGNLVALFGLPPVVPVPPASARRGPVGGRSRSRQ